MQSIDARVKETLTKKILFLPHAVRQMSRPERMISPNDIRHVLMAGKVIEDYPEDPRGNSCLILGKDENSRPIHVVCSPKVDYLAIITAYIPTPDEWVDNFSKRRKS
jgi:hypothetical protein